MARSTRVASRYLEALEADDFTALPAPVFTRGFIRAYCQVVDVPSDEALARYGEAIGEPAAMPVPSNAPAEGFQRPGRNRGTVLASFILLVVLGLALFAVTIFLQAGREGGSDRRARPPASEAPVPESPPPAPVAGPTAERVVPPTPAAPPPPAPEPRPAVPEPRGMATASGADPATVTGEVTSPYRLIARVSELTWIRVRMEDGRFTEETIPAGQVREWVSNAPFVLTVGNAGGVTLELNGRELPPLGARGAVISRLVIPPTPQ
jgi:cytoskeletal protein RodZ